MRRVYVGKAGSGEKVRVGLMTLQVVATRIENAPDLCSMLNTIIRAGDTTALEQEFSPDAFVEQFVMGKHVKSSFTLLMPDGSPIGFQVLTSDYSGDERWADIGTYTDQIRKVKGGGTHLFVRTLAAAREFDLSHIRAVVRADNAAGLAYYAKIGFINFDIFKGVPLSNGMRVDRICKRLVL